MSCDDLLEMLGKHPERMLGAGASDSDIGRAEVLLRLRLRGCYRRFLREYGWGGAADVELFGLGGDVPDHLDLVAVTNSERTVMSPPLRFDLVPLWNDGGGNLYCLDVTSNPEEPPVVFWDHERGQDQAPQLVASDFATWAIELLAEK